MKIKQLDHPFLSRHQSVANVCSELFKTLPISIMNFIRVYNNGKVVYLCDDAAWLENYLINNYPSIGAFEQNTALQHRPQVLWSSFQDDDPIVLDSREKFNIHHGITLSFPCEHGQDYFNFGTYLRENHVKRVFVERQEELLRFVKIFYEKLSPLINRMEAHAIDVKTACASKKNTLPQNLRRTHLGAQFDYAYITPRERECLKCAALGLSAPNIAKQLFISERTVETHIKSLKAKLRCKTQCQLGYRAALLGLVLPEILENTEIYG